MLIYSKERQEAKFAVGHADFWLDSSFHILLSRGNTALQIVLRDKPCRVVDRSCRVTLFS